LLARAPPGAFRARMFFLGFSYDTPWRWRPSVIERFFSDSRNGALFLRLARRIRILTFVGLSARLAQYTRRRRRTYK
ncbi:MAG: hypothetical protein WBY44_17130, partial [Bryobacteraceae bacterium]